MVSFELDTGIAIVALMMEDTKDRPFVRYNAVLSIATGIVLKRVIGSSRSKFIS